MQDIFFVIFIFGGGTLSLLAFSPVGRAFADRIRGRGAEPAYDREVTAELHALRTDIAELQERVDFTERLLAQREPSMIDPGRAE